MAIAADKAVLTSAVVTLMSTVGASVMPKNIGGRGEFPSPKLLIGTSLTFMGLSFVADLAPNLIKPLSAIIAMTALTYYGIPLLDNAFNSKHNPIGAAANKPLS